VREVLYGGLGEELRKDYHRMAGDAFAGSDPDVNVLAFHYYEAGDARAGGYLIKAGDTAKARYANEEAIRFYESSLDMTGEESTEVLEKLGDTLVITGDLDRAVEVFLKVKDTAEDNETMARMLRRVCDAYENKGEYDRALETLTEAKALVGEGTAEFARICRSESAVRFKKGDYDEALALSRAALGIFEEAGLRKDAGNALRDVGKIHLVKGEYDDALDYTEKSLEVMSEIDDHYGTAAALNNMAIVFRNQGEVERALEFYEGGRIIFDIIGDKRALSTLVNNIGSAYHSAGDLDKALEYHELSRRLKRTIGDVMGETAALNNIGNVHSRRGETDKALECHDRSLELTEKLGDKLGIALSCHNIGNIHRLNGEYDTALEYYERSLDIKQQIGYKTMSTLCELAETHLELDDPVTALEYAEKAMDASADIDAKGELGRSRRVLAMVRMKQGKLQEAKEQFEDARTLLEEFGEKIELAALYYEYALSQKQSDRQEEARDLLNRALEMFEGMGMVKWVEKVKTELVRL
jgi:tetratricopeptide (TPR) repeat protein